MIKEIIIEMKVLHMNVFHYFSGISIKNKILATNIILIVISITTIALFANIVSRKAIIEKAINNSSRELALINNNIQTLVSSVEDYSKMLSTDYRLQEILYKDMLENIPDGGLENLNMEKTISAVISNFVEPITIVKAASVLTSRKRWVDVGYASIDSAMHLFGSSPKAVGNINKPFWTGLVPFKFRYESSENDVFAVSKTVIHKDTGKTIGMISLYINETVIAAIYENSLNYKGGEFYILDEKGNVISSRNKALLYHDFSEITAIPLQKLRVGDVSFTFGEGSSEMLISTHRFEPLEWTIVSVIPLDEITVEYKEINKLIIRTGMFCLIIALGISFLLSRSITKPIFELVKTMRTIRFGKMNERSTYQSADEIGILSDGFNNLMDRIETLVTENAEEQRTKAEIEFKLLQSQVKPHFLYNTVETIISLIKLNMGTEAISAAKYMANFYKISLSKGNDIISVKDEVQLTESYLEIQKLRYVEYMDYIMDIDEAILPYSIPKLTLQPLVENAIYYGLKNKAEKGLLRIVGSRDNEQIKIEIYDNGVGMEKWEIEQLLKQPTVRNENISFGARSVHNRIKILYGEQYGLKIESVPNSFTKIIICLPLMELKEHSP